jgi:serine/threonine protein phosphatase PrpC
MLLWSVCRFFPPKQFVENAVPNKTKGRIIVVLLLATMMSSSLFSLSLLTSTIVVDATASLFGITSIVNRIENSNYRQERREPFRRIRGGSSSSVDASSSDDETTTQYTTSSLLPSSPSSTQASRPILYSAYSLQGQRKYMEDEYYIDRDGNFAAVFDGHGGSAVSRYLRQNLYANYQAALPKAASASAVSEDHSDASLSMIVAAALQAALEKVDSEVGSISHWSFQGSTALAMVVVNDDDDENDGNNYYGNDGGSNGGSSRSSSRSIVVANVGDSRAILCRAGQALDLTTDHKPNDESERRRIEECGGRVSWYGEVDMHGHPVSGAGVYRINGNLALSRSIGDRAERPWVTGLADVTRHRIVEHDNKNDTPFALLATDGLFDVMSSQAVAKFVTNLLNRTHIDHRDRIRQDMARYVVEEALRRGTGDNVTVLILWLNDNVK